MKIKTKNILMLTISVICLLATSANVIADAASGFRAGCYRRPSYNACLNCCSRGGHGATCEQACWTVYRRFRAPGNPSVPN